MHKTLVVHHRSGIGDLIWHIPYIRAIAAQSKDGKVTVLARPSCMAADILAGESCVEKVIEYDRRPRNKQLKGRHDSIAGQMRICRQLRAEKFDRIVIFSGRARYGLLALLAGIPIRSGFGFGFAQRLFLNKRPYIRPFSGEGSWVYAEATEFAIAQKFVQSPLPPKMTVPDSLLQEISLQLAPMRRPRFAFAIGSSIAEKNWGNEKFVRLASALIAGGGSVLILGGPAERTVAEHCFSADVFADAQYVHVMCQPSVLKSAAALKTCNFCIGNDTGVLNVAAAVGVPSLGLFGKTLPLTHDPLMHGVSAVSMADISVNAVLNRLVELGAIESQALMVLQGNL